MESPEGTENLITVGFDGSGASVSALRWAVKQAQEQPGTIHVVTTYTPRGGESLDGARMNAEAISKLAAHAGVDDPKLVLRVIQGEPTEVLLACAENSQLLVVGRHGTSGIIHSSLGSVGDACTRLANCPVVIVPPNSPATV